MSLYYYVCPHTTMSVLILLCVLILLYTTRSSIPTKHGAAPLLQGLCFCALVFFALQYTDASTDCPLSAALIYIYIYMYTDASQMRPPCAGLKRLSLCSLILCVLVLLYMCPQTAIYVSSYYYIFVLILQALEAFSCQSGGAASTMLTCADVC